MHENKIENQTELWAAMRFGGWRDAFERLACRLPIQSEFYPLLNPVSGPALGVHFTRPSSYTPYARRV